MTRAQVFGVCLGLTLAIGAAGHHGPSKPASEASAQKLTIREEGDQVVLAWSGPVETAMRDELSAALSKLKADPRRVVISLNSPGGSVARGREVMATIRRAALTREIDTFIGKGAVCASMCVPIYLLGAKRMADPGAHFMFHEVSLDKSALKTARHDASPLDPALIKVVETAATNRLFASDLQGRGVNADWLGRVRWRIAGRELWMSGRQLVDEASGVIDALVETAPR